MSINSLLHGSSTHQHPSTPTKKHRLHDNENETPSRITPRRPLQNVSENDLNIRSSQKDVKDPFSGNLQGIFSKVTKLTPQVGPARNPLFGAAQPSNTQQVMKLSNLLSILCHKQIKRETQVKSAFYQWLSFTLRAQLTAKNAFNTPKKRRMNTVIPGISSTPIDEIPITPTDYDAHLGQPVATATNERPFKSSNWDNNSGKEPKAHSLAEKLRHMDDNHADRPTLFSVKIDRTNSQASERRHQVHVDREKLFDQNRERETPAFHANVDFSCLHKAMRDMTQSSVQTLSRLKSRSNQQPLLENAANGPSLREITARMDYHLGITDMSTEKQVNDYIQNYGYVKPSVHPPLPLVGRGQETTSSGVPLVELSNLRDKFSEWKSRYHCTDQHSSETTNSSL